MKKICGNCKHCQFENKESGCICGNDDSEYFADWIDYRHSCEDFEEKEKAE